MHLAIAPIDKKDDYQNDTGLAGFGAGLRYRPDRYIAMEFAAEFISGTDYMGRNRTEVPLMVNMLGYLNPRDAAQVYLLAGIGMSTATVKYRSGTETVYDYFGGQLGLGLELRVSHPVSLNFDLLGFIRGRTDSKASESPEFVDRDNGRISNTSWGGLIRAGVTLYW